MIDRLKERFHANTARHPEISWAEVEEKLNDSPHILDCLSRMEETGGEPDVIGRYEDGRIIICDCCRESPAERRSLCYDDEALRKRIKNPPAGSAVSQAEQMGVSILTEELYYRLQERGRFDLKTSSWIQTPERQRKKGGALFCERRYDRTFTFHNGADSYYSSRGWRGYVLL